MKRLLLFLLLITSVVAKPLTPNIVFILTDDQGWTDLEGFNEYSSKYYQTPVLKKLAAEGFCFQRAYVEPVCSPTRADILTGLYPTRHHMYTVTDPKDSAKHQLGRRKNERQLDTKFTTISELLSKQGYRCAQIGKWHLGKAGTDTGPKARGFEITYGGSSQGMPGGGKSSTTGPQGPKGGKYWAAEDGSFPFLANLPANGKKGQYLTDRLTDEALKAMEVMKAEPFFLYFPHYGVHAPVQAPQSDIDLYKNQKKDPKHPGHKNADYAGMVSSIDRSVERVVKYLEETEDPRSPGKKLIENTFLVFMSDNGATSRTDNLPLVGKKATPYEGGVRVPLIIKWKDYRGGTETPVHAVDFFATIGELCGVKSLPETDGVSILPLLEGKEIEERGLFRHQPVHVSGAPSSTIIKGRYKLLLQYNSPDSKKYLGYGHYEFYDLESPEGEQLNLAEGLDLAAPALDQAFKNKQHKEVFLQLAKELNQWLADTDAALPYEKGTKKPVKLPKW
ncbi:Arylsulfatase A [Rubritalea squalenifaciens DSM 18772]|uniref:Arylsulfatase A n=1 Tax=Rubritalea squalenifaciens DSM 18772 TaxID=1123071 RepID=A0A1M6H5M6_9BACT|nr:sulfatase [Rubritalea squalenifaciens]SHJ17481.1 Arylsulfatase A [Rubritalea squalenifaciens DSM 18772]